VWSSASSAYMLLNNHLPYDPPLDRLVESPTLVAWTDPRTSRRFTGDVDDELDRIVLPLS